MQSTINFPVEEKALRTSDGINVTEAKAIVRTDTNGVLGIVGKDYKLIKHADVLHTLESHIPTELNLSRVELCKNGAILFAHYDTPKLKPIEVKVGDIVSFGVEIFNSYNGMLKVGFMIVANRLKCTNGMIVPESLAVISQKHTGELDAEDIEEKFSQRVPLFLRAANKWSEWSEFTPDAAAIADFFKKHLGKRLMAELTDRFKAEEDQSLWGLFNLLTYYRTHQIKLRETNKENKRLAQMHFDENVIAPFYDFSWR